MVNEVEDQSCGVALDSIDTLTVRSWPVSDGLESTVAVNG